MRQKQAEADPQAPRQDLQNKNQTHRGAETSRAEGPQQDAG